MNTATIQKAILELVGKLCWSVTAGRITGSRMNLDFGARVKTEVGKDRRIREFGEFGVQIGSAQWRILDGDKILASSTEIIEGEVPVVAGLRELEGKHVTEVNVCGLFDLQMKFENGIELCVFCNDPDDNADNYSISIRGQYYVIECKERKMVLSIRG